VGEYPIGYSSRLVLSVARFGTTTWSGDSRQTKSAASMKCDLSEGGRAWRSIRFGTGEREGTCKRELTPVRRRSWWLPLPKGGDSSFILRKDRKQRSGERWNDSVGGATDGQAWSGANALPAVREQSQSAVPRDGSAWSASYVQSALRESTSRTS
jgi:hypothetical protein